MQASLSWLKELCPFEASAAQVAAVLTARGLAVDAVHEIRDDVVLEVDVPANRPDCLGHLGLARELSAAFGVPLAARPAAPGGQGEPAEGMVRVAVDAPDLCGRYTARIVRGVRAAPSPPWVVARLMASGLHPINNVVDISNLVLLGLGHPIHTFDLSRIEGATIRVRRAEPGEILTTLDGQERRLDRDMLVIADARRPIGIAGVMGGADSQIVETTRDVLIEAAWFSPSSVRATARRLGLATEASHRFERGVDPEGVLAAQEQAVRLLAELAGGTPAPGVVDVYPGRTTRRTLTVRPERVRLLLGYDPGQAAIDGAFHALGLQSSRRPDGSQDVVVPSWRVDLDREVDLVEEVARHLGYDRVPARLAFGEVSRATGAGQLAEERSRDLLSHLGFQEAVCYSMVGVGEDDPFTPPGTASPLALTNPIAEQMARLRRSILPGLVRAVDFNLRRGLRDVRLFEVGRVFLSHERGALPREPVRVGIAWSGAARPRHWSERPTEVALHDVLGVVEVLIEGLHPGFRPRRQPHALAGLDPGRAASWTGSAGQAIAWCGALHSEVRGRMDIAQEIYLAELDLDLLLDEPASPRTVSPIPRVPAVTRDLSFVLDRQVSFEEVLATLGQVAAPAPVEFEVLDRYEGPPLGRDQVSITVRVILQPLEQTLTDAITEAYRGGLVQALRQGLGIELRS